MARHFHSDLPPQSAPSGPHRHATKHSLSDLQLTVPIILIVFKDVIEATRGLPGIAKESYLIWLADGNTGEHIEHPLTHGRNHEAVPCKLLTLRISEHDILEEGGASSWNIEIFTLAGFRVHRV